MENLLVSRWETDILEAKAAKSRSMGQYAGLQNDDLHVRRRSRLVEREDALKIGLKLHENARSSRLRLKLR